MTITFEQEAAPVIKDLKQFDVSSGNWLERIVFNHRLVFVGFCALLTGFLGYQASKLEFNSSFEKMMPKSHEFIKNAQDPLSKELLRSRTNAIRIDVENLKGDIYDADFLKVLQEINDTVYLMPGVDRMFVKSLWMPVVRWTKVTEEGFLGGPVMPPDYDGSAKSIAELKLNVERASIVGNLVAKNQRSSLIFVPLLEIDGTTGKPLDYAEFAHQLNTKIRTKQSDSIGIHIDGFAQLVGDLIDGLFQVMAYFAAAAVMAGLVIYRYTRCISSTMLVIVCSLVAVCWQLGAVHLLGDVLDPYSILVPFLVFAIGVSHGAQKMNGIMQDIGRGTHRYVAARYTFRRLFLAGATALIADAVGFAVLMVIDIPVIRDLAMAASIGVAVLLITNLLLLPVLLSYAGVRPVAAERSLRGETRRETGILHWLGLFTERRYAVVALFLAAILAVGGYMISLQVKIGDLDSGVAELRPDSRYNRDNAYMTKNYGLSSDQFSIIVKTPNGNGSSYPVLLEQDRLAMQLRKLSSVQAIASPAEYIRIILSGSYEGLPKWMTLSRDPGASALTLHNVVYSYPEVLNNDLVVGTVTAYLADHKAETLRNVVTVVKNFADTHNTGDYQFLLAGGSAGVAAATNETVEKASHTMLYLVYSAVVVLCFITFRNWRAVVVAVVPLALTSILAEALMVMLGIGIKVATLPVIALGVGIGVDYALYLLSVQLAHQRAGVPLQEAYRRAIGFTGKVVALVGITLAAGVITWIFSPIKFQADMGILLTFMFIWNMVGALIGIPALSSFLLRDEVFKRGKQPADGTGTVSIPSSAIEIA